MFSVGVFGGHCGFGWLSDWTAVYPVDTRCMMLRFVIIVVKYFELITYASSDESFST